MPLDPRTFEPPAFHARRPGLVRPVRVDPAGLTGPTYGQVEGKGWRRVSRGLYLPARLTAERVEQRIVEAAAALPARGAVTGWAALRWLGLDLVDGRRPDGSPLPVPLWVDDHLRRPQPGAIHSAERILTGSLPWLEILVVDGLPVTSPWRSTAFEVRRAPTLTDAVRWIDLAAARDLVAVDEMATYAAALNGWTGVGRLREAVALADENVWSPTETDLRLAWISIGVTPVLTNPPIFDLAGRHLGTPDVLDPRLGIVGEYDGALHLDGGRRARDITREGTFRRAGLEYVTMTGPDRRDPADFLRRTRDARERQRALGTDRPVRWTLTPPAWWTPTSTVAQRRALTAEQRARYLRRGAA